MKSRTDKHVRASSFVTKLPPKKYAGGPGSVEGS